MGHNNDATNGFGTASGTWAAPTTNDATQGWSTSSDGTAALSGTTTTTTNDTLYFGTDADGLAAGTVTVSGTVEAGHLYFGTNSGAITLSGGTITLGGAAPSITVNNASNTISSILAGSSGWTKEGSGTLTLTAVNTYSGGTVVNSGVLSGDANGLQGSITNDASVVFDQSVDGTYAGVMSGTGAMTKTGAGTLTLSAANTHTGTTTVDAGTLELSTGSAIGSGGSILVNAGAVLRSTAGAAISQNIASFIINGGTYDLASNQIITNGTAITMSNATITGSSPLLWVTGGYVGNGTNTISQIIDARSGAGDYSGLFNIVSGMTTVDGTFRTFDYFVKDGAGTLVLSAVNTNAVSTALVISNGVLEIGGAGQLNSGSYAGDISNAGTFTYNSSAEQTLSGAISGAGALVKSSTGTLTLSGNNTFSGGTDVQGGKLVLSNGGSLQFTVGSVGVVNAITNLGGSSEFDGAFVFDMSGAGTNASDTWQVVTGGAQTYGPNFTNNGWTYDAGVWSVATNSVIYLFTEANGVLSVSNAAVNPYDAWTTQYGLAGTNTNSAADPDGDGFSNGLEYAFGGNPTNGTPSLFGVSAQTSNSVTFAFAARNDLTTPTDYYSVLSTTNLTNAWATNAAVTASISNATDQSGLIDTNYTRREFTVPLTSTNTFYEVDCTFTP